jgi:hypothetical protein
MFTQLEVAWQNRTIGAARDFCGVLGLGLLAAWFYFVWQLLSAPPFASVLTGLPPLLGFALAKAKYMPDFGMIIAGFAAFHLRRELRQEFERPVVVRVYVRAILPLIAYLAVGVILLEAVHMAGPAHAMVLPWQDRLMGVTFRVVATAIIFAVIWPFFLYSMWTAAPSVTSSYVVLALIYYGMMFSLHWHGILWLWTPSALFDFMMGAALCATLFRGVEYLAPVRGAIIIFGWLSILAGSILDGPSLFFLGFLMVASGYALSERSWSLPGERVLLAWSRTALAVVIVQPAILTAWLIWGTRITGVGGLAFLVLAAVTQLVAIALSVAIERPARRIIPA